MDVQGVSRQSLGVSELVRAQVGIGRISLPVKSNQIYASFKNISGIGGGPNQPSFSISQLRSLDNLIERLKFLKGRGVQAVSLESSSENDLSKLIEQFNKDLYKELHKDNPYRAGISASGISLDILV